MWLYFNEIDENNGSINRRIVNIVVPSQIRKPGEDGKAFSSQEKITKF